MSTMKRRDFLKSAGAALMVPAVPLPALSLGTASAAVPRSTYLWAETIARAHRQCSVPMLQRHLKLDAHAVQLVKSQLIKNGVISGQPNAYGVYKAINPLFDGAFIKPTKKRLAQRAISDARAKAEKLNQQTKLHEDGSPIDEMARLEGTKWHGTRQYSDWHAQEAA